MVILSAALHLKHQESPNYRSHDGCTPGEGFPHFFLPDNNACTPADRSASLEDGVALESRKFVPLLWMMKFTGRRITDERTSLGLERDMERC